MKKLLFVALAAVGMTACVQNEELVVAGGKVAIAFENAYVYNATKADNVTTTTGSITGFDVWAYMDEVGGTVLTDEDVTKNGGTWGYTNIQYWTPKHTYYFAALSPMNSANVTETLAADPEAQRGLGTVAFTNVDGTEDLLYAKAKVETPEQSVLSTTGMDAVKFQFQHLLSKVRFTFKNGFLTDNMKVTVSNVEMSAPKSATIDLAVADYAEGWVLGTEKFNLQFGSVEELAAQASAGTAEDRLTIPAAATEEYTVTFDVVVKSGSVVAYEIENMTATIKGYQIKMGCAYNFIAEITPENLELKAIEFDAPVVEAWDYAHGGDEHQAAVGEYVYDVAGLQAKIDAAPVGKTTICLGADIVGDVTVLQKEGVDLIIDGNGYKYDGVITVNGNARAAGKETLTFQNIAFETTEAKTFISAPSKINNRYNYSHNVTVKDCTFTGNYPTAEVGGVSLTGTYNAVVDGCVATGMHSLAQFQSCDNDVLVNNVTVTASKNGVSFGNTARPVLRNATIEAECYGVRADGNASRGALVVENTTITAAQGIVVRKVTSNGYKVTLGENVAINVTDDYQVVFTKGADDAAYVAPEVEYSIVGAEGLGVYPISKVVANLDELAEALKSNDLKTFYLAAGNYGKFPTGFAAGDTLIAEGAVFEGNSKLNINGATVVGATFSNPSGSAVDQTINGTFKGCTFTGSNALRWAYVGATCVFEDCVFSGSVYGVHFDGGANELIFRNCTISGFNGLAGDIKLATFEGCTFVGNGKSGYNGANLWGSAKLVNCEFTFDGSTSNEWIDCIGADKTYEITDCTVNGVALTADNIASSGIFSRNNVAIKLNGLTYQF